MENISGIVYKRLDESHGCEKEEYTFRRGMRIQESRI